MLTNTSIQDQTVAIFFVWATSELRDRFDPKSPTLRSSFQFRNLPLYAQCLHQHNHHRSDCKIYQVRTSFIGQQANLKIS